MIPDGVTSIGEMAFNYCSGLTSVVIPDSVVSIGSYAFSNTYSLQYTAYGNCKYLGNDNNAFAALMGVSDTTLTTYTIHKNTKVIAGNAFYGCSAATSLKFNGSVEEWNAVGKSPSWSYGLSVKTVICTDGTVAI